MDAGGAESPHVVVGGKLVVDSGGNGNGSGEKGKKIPLQQVPPQQAPPEPLVDPAKPLP